MLLNQEVLQQLDAEISKLFKPLLDSIKGTGEGVSSLEQAYIAGKVAAELGPDRLRDMTGAQISKWARDHGLVKSKEDEARLKVLRDSSLMWVSGLVDDLTKRVRSQIASAEDKYAKEVTLRNHDGMLRKSVVEDTWSKVRDGFLDGLVVGISVVVSKFGGWLDRYLQTELARFFQEGQISDVRSLEEVYKIPRPTACPHCMRLHLDAEGNPLVYQLGAVAGNSNIGQRPEQWRFTIGPVHPHCYCILYQVSNRPPMRSPELALARAETLRVSLARRARIAEEAALRYQLALGVDQTFGE